MSEDKKPRAPGSAPDVDTDPSRLTQDARPTLFSDAPPVAPALPVSAADMETWVSQPLPKGQAIDASLGDVVAGKYVLREQLGRGGMGRVYLAEHVGLGKMVALKVMHARLTGDAGYLRRFRKEARAASALDHPNVVRVLDFGQHGNQPYLVMEFVEGESLESWLGNRTTLTPISDVVAIGEQILSALEAMHALEIVHRDLKPANIVRGQDAQGRLLLKVLDFGLAHFSDASDAGPTLTQIDAVAGTPEYMSPEQTRSLRVGPSTDLYAFGCILTELLQGKPPFIGGSPMDILSQHMFAPPRPLSRGKSDEPVPPLLEQLRLDLLAKHQSRRPLDASDARARLLGCLDATSLGAAMLSRRGSAPPVARKDRIPNWNEGAELSSTEPGPALSVVVFSLSQEAGGFDAACDTGLRALGVEVTLTNASQVLSQPGSETTQLMPSIVVADVGALIADGLEIVRKLVSRSSPPRVLVCGADMGIEQVNHWIEAGAADVLAYPLSPDDLARRLRRLARRMAPPSKSPEGSSE